MSHQHHHPLHNLSDDLTSVPVVMDTNNNVGVDNHQHQHIGHHSAAESGGGHSMSFHFSSNETILFSFWHIESVVALLASFMLIILICIGYETLKWYRRRLFEADRHWTNEVGGGGGSGQQVIGGRGQQLQMAENFQLQKTASTSSAADRSHKHLLRTAVDTTFFALQLTIGYLLMLIFMTYNVWLCMAVIIGESIGYFMVNAFLSVSSTIDTSRGVATAGSDTCCG